MKNKKQLIIGLVIAVAAIYYTFRNITFSDIFQILSTINYLYLVPCIVLISFTFIFRAYRWSYLTSAIKSIPAKRLYSPLMIGFMGNLLPARAGEIIRPYLLSKREGISFSSSFATVFVERIFDILALLGISSTLLFSDIKSLPQVTVSENLSLMDLTSKFGLISIITALFIIIFSVTMVFYKNFVNSLIGFFMKPFPSHFHEKILKITQSFSEGLMILKNIKELIVVIFFTVCLWGSCILSYFAFYKVFSLNNLPLISLPILTLTVCIFITILPTPGFVGSFQAACVVALHNMFHIAEVTAVSFGLLAWFINMGYVVVLGTYFIIKDNISMQDLENLSEGDSELTLSNDEV